jgi:hypothetical protein
VPGTQTSYLDQTTLGPKVFSYTVKAVDPSGNVSGASKARGILVPSTLQSPVSIPRARRTVTVNASGVAPVTVTCSGFFIHCGGTLKLMLGKQRLGSRRFSIASGKAAVVKVVLADKAFTMLLNKRRLRVTALLVTNPGTGDPPVTRRLPLRLRVAKGVGK